MTTRASHRCERPKLPRSDKTYRKRWRCPGCGRLWRFTIYGGDGLVESPYSTTTSEASARKPPWWWPLWKRVTR